MLLVVSIGEMLPLGVPVQLSVLVLEVVVGGGCGVVCVSCSSFNIAVSGAVVVGVEAKLARALSQ